MRIPATLVVAFASVLAGSLVLSGLFSNVTHLGHEVQEAKATTLPLNVLDQFRARQMAGDAEAGSNFLRVDEEFVDPENHCEFCTRIEYTTGPRGLAGFAYENANALDLTGAKKVRFWVMGEEGNEKMRFKVAGRTLDNLQERADRLANTLTRGIFDTERFALTTEEVSLENDWRKYEVDLTGVDLRGITHPFGFELAGNGTERQVVYIKGVIFDTEPAEEPLAIVAEEAIETMQAEIISNGTNGTAPASFEFEANITGGFEPYSINLDFGDGSEDDGENITHTFEEAGQYNVTLAVTDSQNQNASDSILIEVAEPEEAEVDQNETGVLPPANVSGTEIPEETTEQGNDTNSTVEEQQPEEEKTPPTLPDTPELEVPEPELPALDVDPEVNAGIDLVAQPGDRVLLGGEVSGVEPETEGLSYEWTQVSGPEVEFDGEDSLNPVITIPDDLERDTKIVLQLQAEYQGDAVDRDSIRISVDHVDEILDVEEESIEPSANEVVEWDGECDNAAYCMGDDSDSTFAATSDHAVNLFSFEEFDAENVDEIERVTAIVTAQRAGDFGYLSIVAADEDDLDDREESLGISILSDSFDEYELILEENPLTNRPWTVESLNSFVAGYMYAAGQGDIQVGEFELVVEYTIEEQQLLEEESAEATEADEEEDKPEPTIEEPGGNSTSGGNSTDS